MKPDFPTSGTRRFEEAADTQAFGEEVGRALEAGDVVILDGPLGAGKTTFTQGLARGLQVKGRVTSPTFVIAREHRSEVGGPDLIHMDAYRLLGEDDESADPIGALDSLDLDTDLDSGVIGHGMGAGAAVLAAANRDIVHAVGAIYPAKTSPSALDAAFSVKAPGLVIGSAQLSLFETPEASKLAANWAGHVAYREMEKGTQQGFSEDALFQLFAGIGRPQTGAQETVRGLITGFLLHTLAEEKKYKAFSDPTAEAKKVKSYFGQELQEHAFPKDNSPFAFLNEKNQEIAS